MLNRCNIHEKNGENYTLKKKHLYYGQIQLSMCILGVDSCDFVLYSSYDKSIYVINVEINLDFYESLLVKLKDAFYNNMQHILCKNNM